MKLLGSVLFVVASILNAQECPEPQILSISPSEINENKISIEFDNNNHLYADLWECDIMTEDEPGDEPNFEMNNIQSPYEKDMRDNFFKIWIRTDCGKQINNQDNQLVSEWVGPYYYDIQPEEEN